MKKVRITQGAAALLECMKHGWNVKVALPADVRDIDLPGYVETTLRPGKSTDTSFSPKDTWNGRDGLVLVDAGLLRSHGRGGVFVPVADLFDVDVEVMSENEVGSFARKTQVETLSVYADAESTMISFDWKDEDRLVTIAFELTPGELLSVRRVISGGAIDRIEVGGGMICMNTGGTVTIVKAEALAAIDLTINQDMIERLGAVLEDASTGPYQAVVRFSVDGATYR